MDINTNNYWEKQNKIGQQEIAERAENIDKYGIHVPDDVYAEMNKVIANSDNPEESAYRFGTAYQYSQMFDIPFSEAYEKQDEFNHALYGAETNKSAKEWYTAVSDAFVMGKNNVRIGQLGNEIRAAMIDGDEEKLNLLYKELDILERDNETRQDNIPRMWTVEALKAGAESLPFTTASMVPGIIGCFISPGVGLTAGAVTSASLMSGQEYLELRKNGASHEVANVVANISGGLQGIVEVALGKSLETVGAVGGAVGKKVVGEGLRKQAIEKITNAVGKKLHYGAAAKIASNIALRSVEGTLEEGAEEAIQELISIGGQALAAELENYDLPPEVADDIGKQTFEAFKGGILGSLVLGGLPVAINTVASVKDYQTIKKAAETIESPEMFKDVVKNSKEGKRVFSGFSDDKKDAVIDQVFKEAQTARDKNHDEMYAEQKESYTYDEETSYTDEEGNEVDIEVTPEYRTESGELKTDIQTTTDEDGNTKGTFRIVDENNTQSYGHIDYTLDEETQTVTIDNFKMANKNRDVLRAETFDAFAQYMAGYKIEWNPAYSKSKGFKEYLVKNNPYGEAQGLNYYKDVSAVADVKTRKSVDKQLQANIKNLTARERSAAIVLLESAALKKGLGLTEYVNQTFNNGQIFGNLEEAQAMAQKQNGADVKMQGAMLWRRFGAETRAVIYASEHSNFSTWAHELAHIWHDQLEGDLKTEAEKAFGVVNGDWRNTPFTFADGTVSTAAEGFARGFEDYLKTGKAPSNSLKKIFQDFAEFLARVYNGLKNFIKMSPEITSVYDQLLQGDDSLLRLAEKAVIEQEIQNKLARQRQQAEQEKQAQEQQKEERAVKEREIEEAQEEYDETEQLEDETVEEETTVEEEEITDTVQEDIINSLDATNKVDAQKVADILTDENASKETKETTALDSAGKNRDEEFAIFQLAGVNGIRNMAYSMKKKERLDALAVAQNMLEKASPLEGAKVTMQRIKWATGWDKNASGKWVYELDTSLFRIKNIGAFTKILQSEPQQLVRATDLTVDTILDAPELFEIYPLLRNIKVTFVNDYTGFRGGFGNNGIILNTRYIDKVNTEKGLKGVLVHEIQHAIQALEAAQSEDIKDKNNLVAIVENFRKVYAKLQQRQMNAGHFYDQDTDKFDASMQAYMNDELEIDARAVAKRTLLKSDERRHSIIANSTDVDITEKIVQQVIGVEGAQRLDDAYEVYERMDNYRIAREMELAGKSAKDIKLATGWERGVDTKWRYEIDDITLNGEKLVENKFNYISGGFIEPLKNLINDGDLLKAYPALANINVVVTPHIDVNGSFSPADYTIKINKDLFEKYRENFSIEADEDGNILAIVEDDSFKSTLIHEIQHAIQDIEGFAVGGNPENFKTIQASPLEKALASYAGYSKEELAQITEESQKQFLREQAHFTEEEIAEALPDIGGLGNIAQIIERSVRDGKLDVLYEEMQEAAKNVQSEGRVEVKGNYYSSPLNAYASIAGEVEACNVQNRMYMSPDKRRETLLAETMDIAEEEQIVLFQELVNAENNSLEDVRKQYINTDKWLKAPNGNDTNLTEKQWLQVRTPSFKKWFGDWENDPENASKVVDENGEPLVVYHGTSESFDVFGKETREGENFHFGTKEQAELRVKDYIEFIEADINRKKEDVKNANSETSKFYSRNTILQLQKQLEGFKNPKFMAVYLDIKNPKREQDENLWYKKTKEAKSLGYDGFVYYNVYENTGDDSYAVFSPNQIKSATDNSGEFNADNPSILFQNTKLSKNIINEFVSFFDNYEVGNKTDEQLFNDIKRLSILNGQAHKGYLANDYDNRNGIIYETKDIVLKKIIDYLLNNKSSIEVLTDSNVVYFEYKDQQYSFHVRFNEDFLNKIRQKQSHMPVWDGVVGLFGELEKEISDLNLEVSKEIKRLEDVRNSKYWELKEKSPLTKLRELLYDDIELFYPSGDLFPEVTLEKILAKKKTKADYFGEDYSGNSTVKEYKSKIEEAKTKKTKEKYEKLLEEILIKYKEYDDKILEERKQIATLYEAIKSMPDYSAEADKFIQNDVDKLKEKKHVLDKKRELIKQKLINAFYSNESNPSILYQTAYHGSPHNFDRFTTDAIGTGEGAQAFGWGLYFTNQEDIARWYADKLSKNNIEIYREQLKQGALDNPYNKDTVEYEIFRDLMSFDFDLFKYKDYLNKEINNLLTDADNPYNDTNAEQKKLKLKDFEKELFNRNLYTVELPEGKYLYWDKAYEGNDYKLILEDIKQAIKNNPNSETEWALKAIDQTLYEGITGADLYHHLTFLIDDGEERNPEKITSKLLKSIGYIGIDYPAASLSNMIIAEGKRNYVIFDDEDVKVLEHLTYQTLDELYTDARDFDSWESFMEVYEGWLKPEPSLVPENADASWYKATWEMAHGMVTEPDETLPKNDNPSAMSLDALFLMEIKKPGKLEEFLKNIHYLNTLNFDVMGEPMDEEDAAQREVQAQLQYFMRKSLTHGSWFSNAARVFNDKPLTDKARKTMLTLIEHSTRDYRDIYSELMGREDFAVPAEEKISTNIKLGLHGIEGANTDILSPEKRRQISEQIRNDEIAQKIKDGTMPMNDELDRYIKKLEKDTKEAEKKYDELKETTEQDYKRLSDWQQRQLIELQDEMLKARARYKNKSDETSRKINRGIKLTEQYLKEERALKASYDKLFKQYSDLIKAQRLNADINDAIERRENWYRVKEDLKEKRDEKRVIEQIKKLRIQLVKRTMRRVPFNRVDFKSAKTLIAIQRIFEPNLFGGVNKWIGTEGSYLRAVWSSWQTDSEFREKTEKRLQKYKSGAKVIELLNNSKTVEDFNKWTSKERARLHRLLPKEDWIRELKLEDLAEERADSIQLDITTKEDVKYDANGKAYILTTPVMSDEVKELVLDALGQDLFNQLVYRPFAEWTTEEMETLAKRVDEIYTDGKATLQAKKDAQIEQANRIRENIERAVKNTGIVINPGDSEEVKQKKREQIAKILGEDVSVKGTIDGKRDGLFGRLGKILHGYSDANILRVARILDGYQDGTNVIQLYRRENDCYIAKNNAINQRTSKINQAMKDNKIKLNELFESVEIKDFYKGESVSFTVDELLFFMKASLDEKAKEAVMYGNMMSGSIMQKYKQEFINADEQAQTIDMVGADLPGTHAYKEICEMLFDKVLTTANSLDKKFLNFADAISDDYAIQFDRLQEASINEFNTPVWRENNYIPLVRLESNGDTNHNRVKEDLLGTLGSGTQTKQWADKGMTKKRIKISPLYQAPVETGLYKTWVDSVERTEHFIAYAGYVRELNRVYKSKDARFTRRFIEDRYGKGMVDYIDNYINEVANPNANAALSDMDRIVKILRGRTAPAYLAWKTSSIVKQSLTSPWPFIQFMNPAQYLKSCFDIITKKNMYETIQAKSVFMRNRKIDPIIDLIDEQLNKKTNPVMSKVNQFNKIGMTGLEMIDWVCVAPGWLAAYEERYKALTKKNDDVYEITKAQLQEENDKLDIVSSERMTEQQIETEAQKAVLTESEIEAKAVEYADDVVRQCQPSNRSVDLAPLFKQKGPGSEIIKAVLQFQTSLNVIWQNIRYDIPMAVRQKEFKKVVGTIGGYVMAGIMMNAVCEGFGGDDGEDEELTALKKLIFYSTTQFTDAIPVIGSYVTKTTEQLITGETPYSTNNDLFPLLTKYRQGTQQAIKGNWDKAAGKYAEALGLTFGAPVSGVKELLDIVSNEDGEDGLHFESLIGR